MTNSGKSMSNSYGRDVTLEFAHHDTDRLLGLGVQSTCGLVENEKPRPREQRARHTESLTLASA